MGNIKQLDGEFKIPDNKYLGILCRRGHNYDNTGYSLRLKSDGACIECAKICCQKPERKIQKREYHQRQEVKDRQREYRQSEKHKEYRQTEKYKSIQRRYRQSEEGRLCQKRYRQSEKGKVTRRKYNEEYRQSPKYKAYRKEWELQRYHKSRKYDLMWRLNNRMSEGIRRSLKNGNKGGQHCFDLMDFTIGQLKRELDLHMPEGYTWQDFLNGLLHLEHTVPIAAHNFSDTSHIDFKRCWSLDNLRLMPAKENLKKGARLSQPFQPSFAF